MSNPDHTSLVEALKSLRQPEGGGIVSGNTLNVLVMGVLAAAGALVWNTVTGTPESFGLIQQQTAEIRTTVLEMRSTLTDLTERLQENTRDTGQIQTKVSALESQVEANKGRIDRLEQEVSRGR